MSWRRQSVDISDVAWCYRNILGREPENDEVVLEKIRTKFFKALVEEFVSSDEFQGIVRSQKLSVEDVVWCYENLLFRKPESDSVVMEKIGHGNFRSLVSEIVASDEFSAKRQLLASWTDLSFEVVNGRPPDGSDVIEDYSSDRIVSTIRRALRNQYDSNDRQAANLDEQAAAHAKNFDYGANTLLIFQTCDHERYVPILQATSRTVLEYVRRWHCSYEVFYGIKRGVFPWHATFNRIHKLDELVRSGFKGWVLYLDADAYFVDFDFDLLAWLSGFSNYALVAARISDTEPNYWNINAGVFFLNLGHEVGRNLVSRWKSYYDSRYEASDYESAPNWDMIVNDQTSLHSVLRDIFFEKFILTQGVESFINSHHARLIRQMLRHDHLTNDDDNFQTRLFSIESEVARVLKSRA